MSVLTSQPPPQMQQRMGGPRYPPPSHFNTDHHSSSHAPMPRPRMAYQPYRLYPRPPPPGGGGSGGGTDANMEYDGRRLRKSLVRKTVDYNAAVIKSLQVPINNTSTLLKYL